MDASPLSQRSLRISIVVVGLLILVGLWYARTLHREQISSRSTVITRHTAPSGAPAAPPTDRPVRQGIKP